LGPTRDLVKEFQSLITNNDLKQADRLLASNPVEDFNLYFISITHRTQLVEHAIRRHLLELTKLCLDHKMRFPSDPVRLVCFYRCSPTPPEFVMERERAMLNLLADNGYQFSPKDLTGALECKRSMYLELFMAHGVVPSQDHVIALLSNPRTVHAVETIMDKMGHELEGEHLQLAARNDWEWCVRVIQGGRLPIESSFSDNVLDMHKVDVIKMILEKGAEVTDKHISIACQEKRPLATLTMLLQFGRLDKKQLSTIYSIKLQSLLTHDEYSSYSSQKVVEILMIVLAKAPE